MNFIIPIDIYNTSVMVSIGETDAELLKKLKRYGVEKEGIEGELWKYQSEVNGGRGVFFRCHRGLIRLRHKPTTPHLKGGLAHEIFHVVDFMLRRAGFELSYKSYEAWAYGIGFLTEQIYKKLK